MRRWQGSLVAGLSLAVAMAAAAMAQEPPPTAPDRLVIGTKDAPPFAMKDEAGRWAGISIELWRAIADDLGLEYEIREYDLEGLLEAVENGAVDAGVAALTVTADREAVMDFSHPFYTTGFGIAVAPFHHATWLSGIRRFFHYRFLQAVGLLLLTLLAVGTLTWLAERSKNPEQYPPRPAEGIWNGLWWAAVTMVTVGYGDKAPRTVIGRILGMCWMFTSVVLLASFLASMTSALTVSQLEAPIRGPEDLAQARVATLARSTSEAFLREQRIPFQYYDSLQQALQAVADRQVDAVVYDAPLLQYQVTQTFAGKAEVLPRTFGRQDYSIALPTGSALREPINRALLSDAIRARWQDILFRYLQEAPAPPPKPS